MASTGSLIELSDMIVGLRKELKEAQTKAENEDLKFRVESIDVEAQVTVTVDKKLKGAAKWKFWIFSEAGIEAEAGVSREAVQTIRLKLTPQQSSGEDVLVDDEDDAP